MYIQEELSEEYYNFLLREVAPRARKLGFYAVDIQLKEKIELLKLVGVEELLIASEDGDVRTPVSDCPRHEIHLAAYQVASYVNMYIQRHQKMKREEDAKPKITQLKLTPVDLAGNLNAPQQQGRECVPGDAAYAHSRRKS